MSDRVVPLLAAILCSGAALLLAKTLDLDVTAVVAWVAFWGVLTHRHDSDV